MQPSSEWHLLQALHYETSFPRSVWNNVEKLVENGEPVLGREIGSLADDMRIHIEREPTHGGLALSTAICIFEELRMMSPD